MEKQEKEMLISIMEEVKNIKNIVEGLEKEHQEEKTKRKEQERHERMEKMCENRTCRWLGIGFLTFAIIMIIFVLLGVIPASP